MALGFIKKIFSFGRKDVEESPVDAPAALPPAAEPLVPEQGAASPAVDNAVEGPVPEFLLQPQPEPAAPVSSEPSGGAKEAEPVAFHPVPEPLPLPEVPVATPPRVEAVPIPPFLQPGHTPPDHEPSMRATPAVQPDKPTPTAPDEPPIAAEPEVASPPEPTPLPEPDRLAQPASSSAPALQPEPETSPATAPPVVQQHTTPASPRVLEPDVGSLQPKDAPPAEASPSLVPAAAVETTDRIGDAGSSAAVSVMPDAQPAEAPPAAPAGDLGAGTAETPLPSPGRVTVAKSVERKAEAAPVVEAPAPRKPWFQRLRDGLSRSSRELSSNISGIFTKRKLDEDTLQDLEDVLIRADLGVETALRVTDALAASRYGKDVSDADVRAVMAQEVEKVLVPVALPLELDLSHKPHVILVVGVNGTGKTTTIGKLAAKLTAGGLSVTLAAGDTFRAAAIEQLKIWGERTGSPVVSSKLGADAAGLAWDAFEKAKQAGSDVLIIDTAGRLQNKTELMAELEKIVRVLGKHDPEAPHTVLQTVDATTGQNALNQVEIFRNVAGVNGLVMTKLDGTARGGILVAIAAKHRLPVYFIGVGEQVDDLEPFSASDFAKAIAGVN